MNNNGIEKTGNNGKAMKALDDEWCLMNAALERLGQVEAREQTSARRGGRLIYSASIIPEAGKRVCVRRGLRQRRCSTRSRLSARSR
jgi:hypothetical protein